MVGTDPGSAREEAERLVATALAALRLAGVGADRAGGYGPLGNMVLGALGHPSGLATGSAECSVCPICRTIAALRDPRPEVAERLASGAADLAAGVASLMRAFATVAGPTDRPAGAPRAAAPEAPTPAPAADPGPAAVREPAEPATVREPADGGWRAAAGIRHDLWPAAEPDVWAAATRTATSRTPVEPSTVGDDAPGNGA